MVPTDTVGLYAGWDRIQRSDWYSLIIKGLAAFYRISLVFCIRFVLRAELPASPAVAANGPRAVKDCASFVCAKLDGYDDFKHTGAYL